MACELWQDKLGPYVDGELSSAEATEFGQHARQCVTCTADVLESVRMKRLIAVAGKAYTPSSEFRATAINRFMRTLSKTSAVQVTHCRACWPNSVASASESSPST